MPSFSLPLSAGALVHGEVVLQPEWSPAEAEKVAVLRRGKTKPAEDRGKVHAHDLGLLSGSERLPDGLAKLCRCVHFSRHNASLLSHLTAVRIEPTAVHSHVGMRLSGFPCRLSVSKDGAPPGGGVLRKKGDGDSALPSER